MIYKLISNHCFMPTKDVHQNLILLSLQFRNRLCADVDYSTIVLFITIVINIIICFVVIPINIRLAGQMIMQVFKYRFIVKYHATDSDDNKVITAYYQHFQVILAIVISFLDSMFSI